MTNVETNIKVGEYELHTPGLIACNHCGIVALNTPAFGWRRWYDEEGELAHHCPVAVQYEDLVRGFLVHGKVPDEAVVYEDTERWIAEVVGAEPDSEPEQKQEFWPENDLGDDPDGDASVDPRDT